jgi:hypothetical protein
MGEDYYPMPWPILTYDIRSPQSLHRLISMDKKRKPLVSEPSPRFARWSAVVAAAALIGIVIFDYTIGAKDFASPQAAQAATPRGR